MKIRVGELKALIREALAPEYTADLDKVMGQIQVVLKGLEAAHEKAPDPKSKVVIAGIHSDIFNSAAYIRKLKSGQVD